MFIWSLWTVLSNISNDPLGIQYQWRKSNTERLFHRALGARGRTNPPVISDLNSKPSDLGNSFTDKIDEDRKLNELFN
jgi:hypothetical protein